MPECGFSETQFSFCFTFEFIQKYTFWCIIPFFPSTYMEGQPGYGYDVQVNNHLYFQFKRPFLVSRRRNPNQAQWDTFGRSYLRIHIHTDDEQHKLLHLLKARAPQNKVFYIAPEFNRQDDISRHYINNQIVPNSLIVAIEDFPPHGSGHHSLCYLAGASFAYLFSQPQQVNKQNLEELLFSGNREQQALPLAEEAERIMGLLNELKMPRNLFINQPEGRDERVNYVKNILLSQFNILWMPVIAEGQELTLRLR
ncbi:hypothetical protein [Flavobacterium wongokense]|uniref:hypothetical protein n=1 Tax=Flavobacterium wongokense TaxID=2910674 RepID=UPI001F22919D|nr:hypothetical protein [Flavobacterium sp. WG47]MCF6132506.1 hypothetical protein [Flavobacterium sp. WG47]